ncbi:MAG: tripartite tricarboxylate transporter substrate binding protein [Rhodovarius sp.]|nr:tripartite tricarboxylate transporter substrate binding protein [Rhodovarius sp.]
MIRLLLAALLVLVTLPAFAQSPAWPGGRMIRIVITYPPGGTTDFVARFLAQRLQEQIGSPMVVENRPGGGGVIGWTHVVRSAPDGTTFLLTDNSLATAPPLHPNLGFDIRTDFTPVSLLVDYPTVFVVPGTSPHRSLRGLIEALRGQPADAYFYGSMGAGSSPHLYTEFLQDLTGIRMTHVPYRGMGPAFTDLLAGRVGLLIAAPPTVLAAVREGRAHAIAIGTTGGRIPALPDVPTAREQGIDFTYSFWYGLLGPRGLDPAIVLRMQQEIARFLALPEVRERFAQQGGVPVGGDGAALLRVMESDLARWSEVIRARGITLQD